MDVDADAHPEAAQSTPTPTIFAPLASTMALVETLHQLDLNLVCTAESAPRINEDDYFGYSSSPPYESLFTLCADAGGSSYHLWTGSGAPEPPVVMIGSEGECGKVGSSASHFLQLALSLQPHWNDAVRALPAAPGGFDPVLAAHLAEGFPGEDAEETAQARQQAGDVLVALGLERLAVAAALEQLGETNLSVPRFTPLPEDE